MEDGIGAIEADFAADDDGGDDGDDQDDEDEDLADGCADIRLHMNVSNLSMSR
jgi:hypothetical protein